MSETTDHQALARFLRIAAAKLPDLAFVWHTPNESAGGARNDKGVPLDVLKEARMGTVAGVWDWLFLGCNLAPIQLAPTARYHGVAIELKSTSAYRSKNRGLSDAQLEWQNRYEINGWYTAVFCEWTEAAQLLIRWVGGDVNDFRF